MLDFTGDHLSGYFGNCIILKYIFISWYLPYSLLHFPLENTVFFHISLYLHFRLKTRACKLIPLMTFHNWTPPSTQKETDALPPSLPPPWTTTPSWQLLTINSCPKQLQSLHLHRVLPQSTPEPINSQIFSRVSTVLARVSHPLILL